MRLLGGAEEADAVVAVALIIAGVAAGVVAGGVGEVLRGPCPVGDVPARNTAGCGELLVGDLDLEGVDDGGGGVLVLVSARLLAALGVVGLEGVVAGGEVDAVDGCIAS